MEHHLFQLLESKMKTGSSDEFISHPSTIKSNTPPPTFAISSRTFIIVPTTPITLADLHSKKHLIHAIRIGRTVMTPDNIPADMDINKITIYLTPKLYIKLGSEYKVSGCVNMVDDMLLIHQLGCGGGEPISTGATGVGSLCSSINLHQLAITMSKTFSSAVDEPNKNRLVVKNINGEGGSITITAKGTIQIMGRSDAQVMELFHLVRDLVHV